MKKRKIIPHEKIEKLIAGSNIPYTFLRPACFMQNFTTTLHNDLVKHHIIFLRAGNAKFVLVDVIDIDKEATKILTETEKQQARTKAKNHGIVTANSIH